MNFINYFFDIVVPQLLEYFKENAKDVPYSFLSEVLINNKNYEKEVKEISDGREPSKKILHGLGPFHPFTVSPWMLLP